MRSTILALGLIVNASLLFGGLALADAPGEVDGHMMSGGWITGPFMMLLMGAIIVAAVVIVLKLLGASGKQNQKSSGLHILEERYARGEIDKEEFEERKKTLVG